MPIEFSAVRKQERLRILRWIAAQPSAARFVVGGTATPITLTVRISEAPKLREMKLGGFSPAFDIEATIALSIPTAKPEPQKDLIEIEDLDTAYNAYLITDVVSLRGTSCYRLSLKSRRSLPTRVAPTIQGVNA